MSSSRIMTSLLFPFAVDSFRKKNGLKSLGMPHLVGHGSHDFNQIKHRFVVMPRYGKDVWNLFVENNRKMPQHTVYRLAIQMVWPTTTALNSHPLNLSKLIFLFRFAVGRLPIYSRVLLHSRRSERQQHIARLWKRGRTSGIPRGLRVSQPIQSRRIQTESKEDARWHH